MNINWSDIGYIVLGYFFRLFSFAALGFIYSCFRGGLEDRLIRMNRIYGSKIPELKKGLKNFWFLTALHKKVNLGFWYKFNYVFVVWYGILSVIVYFGGFIDVIAKVISIVSIPLYFMAFIMNTLYNIEHNWYCHGKPLVFFAIDRKIKSGAVDSIILDLWEYCFIGMLAYANIVLAFK